MFCLLRRQWVMGMNGPVGLDFSPLALAMEACGVQRERLGEIWIELQIMEAAALKALRGED